MRPVDAEAKIKEYAATLNVTAFAAKMREFTKMGLPGSSFSDGRGTAEPPLPLMGNIDRRIQQDRQLHDQAVLHAALALEQASRIEAHWTQPVDTDTEKAKKLNPDRPGGPCKNFHCDHWMTGLQNDRPRNGRCQPCDQHWRRTGTERDPRVVTEVTDRKAL